MTFAVYTNSLLATLNARNMIRDAGKEARSAGGMPLSLRDFPNRDSTSGGQVNYITIYPRCPPRGFPRLADSFFREHV